MDMYTDMSRDEENIHHTENIRRGEKRIEWQCDAPGLLERVPFPEHV
jgi:hypothetical protein